MSETKPTSVWVYKPWWCQPWSILLTGIAIISGSWFVSRTLWITGLVSLPISAWMIYFVLIYPKLVLSSGMLDLPHQTAEDLSKE